MRDVAVAGGSRPAAASDRAWHAGRQRAPVELASKSLRDLRVAEVVELDMQIEDGKALAYRAKVKLSFKYLSED